MRNVSNEFRKALYFNDRNYLAYADITLESGTVLNLTNSEIWSGGFSNDDAVSEDDSFSALGSTIINSATLIINNMYDTFSDYEFYNAKVVLSIAKTFPDSTSDSGERLEQIKIGTYTADDVVYNGTTITLTLLDYMEQFDRPYGLSNLTYPASLSDIVIDACTKCGVTFNSYSFPHKDYVVNDRPDDDSTTFREVIGWAATIAGCYARCNVDGKLEFKWFDRELLDNEIDDVLDGGTFEPWTTGTVTDGGTFNPWTTGDTTDGGEFTDTKPVHHISSFVSYLQTISVYSIIITGVSIAVKADDEQSVKLFTCGTSGYIIGIEDNPFITTSTAQTVADWLGDQLIGLTFRKAEVRHSNDPSIEAGDIAIIWDRKRNGYPILVTRTSFSIGSQQTTVCGAETLLGNSSTRSSRGLKNYIETKKLLHDEQTIREQQIEDLADKLDETSGLYTTVQSSSSGSIYYLHDLPELSDSSIVWKMTKDAFGVSTDGGKTWNAGLTVDGNFIAQIMSTIGLDFDWGTGGTLTLGGKDNINGNLRVLDADENLIASIDKEGIVTQGKSSTTTAMPLAKTLITGGIVRLYSVKNNLSNHMLSLQLANDGVGAHGGLYGGSDASGIDFGFHDAYLTTYPEVRTGNHQYYTGQADYTYRHNFYGGVRFQGTIQVIQGTYKPSFIYMLDTGPLTAGSLSVRTSITAQSLQVTGTKNRIADTADYGDRLLYSYETPTPLFGDVGDGVIGEDGLCYIQIDPAFSETINTSQYQVFLQAYDNGNCFVKDRFSTYFVVEGKPNMQFGWELKARQLGFEQLRLETNRQNIRFDDTNYGELATTHIQEINKQREVTL